MSSVLQELGRTVLDAWGEEEVPIMSNGRHILTGQTREVKLTLAMRDFENIKSQDKPL